jgi:two-component system sensor histidine kinase UhpB
MAHPRVTRKLPGKVEVRRGFRSLFGQSLLWIAGPLALLMIGLMLMAVLSYQRVVAALLLDRDRQLAVLSANRISQDLDIYVDPLEAMAVEWSDDLSRSGREPILQDPPSGVLQLFNAGVVIVDANGRVLEAAPARAAPLGNHVALRSYFVRAKRSLRPVFSSVTTDARTGEDMVVIAVPVLDEADEFGGAVIGAIHLHTSPLGEPLRRLVVGDEGFAYMVDSEGRVIFHPDRSLIGADFSGRPFISTLLKGNSGGQLSTGQAGEPLVLGYAPIDGKGWGLVIREPWEDVINPARPYGALIGLSALFGALIVAILLYHGARRVTEPVRFLAGQTSRLAMGESVEPAAEAGIRELDALALAFNQMANQIAAYRAGLRRYVGAITRSQEQERLRISRELHDETSQNLLAMSRGLELGMSEERDPQLLRRLEGLKALVDETLLGVRQIGRDLRPFVLEDLGLVAALRALAEGRGVDDRSAPRVHLAVEGSSAALTDEQELGLYRITQEALTNARKHARASHVWVDLRFEPEEVRLQIRDDGHGFSVPDNLTELTQNGNYGLMGIQERAWVLNGSLEIDSEPGGGTRIRVTIPLEAGVSRMQPLA